MAEDGQAMTTNQTPDSALDAAVLDATMEVVLEYGNEREAGFAKIIGIGAVRDAIRGYGEARYEAGRRDALEALPCTGPYINVGPGYTCGEYWSEDRSWGISGAEKCDRCNALATPTETKP